MAGLLEDVDLNRLKRGIESNQVLLFLGAGFSNEATARSGRTLPTSKQLAELLWTYLGYPVPYDGSALKDVFHAALRSPKGHQPLRFLLEENLLVRDVPKWYNFLTSVFWHRIYTTNIDNLIERVYQDAVIGPKLDLVVAPRDDYKERDQFLNSIQLIKLHGSLPGRVDEITFSARQVASRSADRYDVWYEHFVGDFTTHIAVLIGTELDEPLFLEYLEAREKRRPGQSEPRPGGFLVTPQVSPPKLALLEELGLKHLPLKAKEFAEFLTKELGPLPVFEDVLAQTQPAFSAALKVTPKGLSTSEKEALEDLFRAFEPVPSPQKSASHRKLFFLGQTPSWQDIAHDFDAARDINATLLASIKAAYEQSNKGKVIAVLGSAGCGKSTIMRRTAVSLSQEGIGGYFSDIGILPDPETFIIAAKLLSKKLVLFVDSAETGFPALAALLRKASGLPKPPVVVVASRGNAFARWKVPILESMQVEELRVPNLTDSDADRLLAVLEKHHALGKLKGMSPAQRKREITDRAWKQLLVALREATQGSGFDEIIKGEYQQIEPIEARQIYLCAALATEAGYRLTKEEIVLSSNTDNVATLEFLNSNLRDVVVPYGAKGDFYAARHPLIAEFLVEESAPRSELRASYLALLAVLAKSMSRGDRRKDRAFQIYRQLISHAEIYRRFLKSIEDARAIYRALEDSFSNDHHFWLQYGSLELEYGELDLAGLYLNQAASLVPDDNLVITSLGYLDLRKAREAPSLAQATALRERGEQAILGQIALRGNRDSYPYHILGSQRLGWLHRWVTDQETLKGELGDTLHVLNEGIERHPYVDELKQLKADVEKEYLKLAVVK